MSQAEFHEHEFPPVFDSESRILILGSFPSVKSREVQFYYGHPQNRFWKLLAKLLGEEIPADVPGKIDFLHRNHIALWDVIESCEIVGSSDSSIKNVIPTDVGRILEQSSVETIFANGAAAAKLFERYQKKTIGRDIIKLPSTSPANAAWSLERLYQDWQPVAEALR